MPFDCVRTPDGACFTHKPSGRTFACERFRPERGTLTLLLMDEADNDYVAMATTLFSHHDFFEDKKKLKYPRGAYGLKTIEVDDFNSNISLGALLMLLLTLEVQANGGQHLYLIDPITKSRGFYIQFGFHPDPGIVNDPNEELAQLNISGHSGGEFEEKFIKGRNYILWRGQVGIVLGLLLNKVTPTFQFHQAL